MSIVAVGTLGLDNIETPREKKDRILGGSATYISLAARPLAHPVAMIAVAGKDFPEDYRQLFHTSDLDLSGVEILEDHDTFAWGGIYHENLNIRTTTFTHLNALAKFNPIVPTNYKNCKILCLGNLSPKTQLQTLGQVNGTSFALCDTMNYWIDHTPDELRDVLGRIDCLLINDEEAYQLTGKSNLFTAAGLVLSMGPRILIIKKGEHGAILFVEEQVFIAPGFPLENVQDPTGAGDAFLGAFAGSLANESKIGLNALKRAMVYGCTVASFCVEVIGPYNLFQLSESVIEERAKIFRGFTEWPSWN